MISNLLKNANLMSALLIDSDELKEEFPDEINVELSSLFHEFRGLYGYINFNPDYVITSATSSLFPVDERKDAFRVDTVVVVGYYFD